jgi:hypothetical protein
MNPTTKREADPALSIGPDGNHSRTRLTHTHNFVVPVQASMGSVGPFALHVRATHQHHNGNVQGEHLEHVAHLDGHWEVATDADAGSGRADLPEIMRRVDVMRSVQYLSPMDKRMRTVTLDKRSPTDRETERMYKNFRRRWAVQS